MVGQTISQYKILEKLGEGGLGVVYKAHDEKLDRTVALKFLPHHLTVNEAEQARFLQEARAAATLNHPNVCTIFDIKEEGGQQFIVMEFVDGKTLRHIVTGSPPGMQDAVAYAIQIGDALHEAHTKGIVHRDVKAENIMLNQKKQIKVMDFGLAKLKGSLKLTKTSSTVGTLAYMAPEQIQGGEVDARSDIFSFGVVLFEMLTGKIPFRGEHDAALMYSIVNEEPEPLQVHMPDASSELLHVINRALEKDPEDRYQTVHDMVIDLRRLKKDSSRVSRVTMRAETLDAPQAPAPDTKSDPVESRRTVTLNLPRVHPKTMLRWVVPLLVVVIGVAGYFLFSSGGDVFEGERIPVAVADFHNQTKDDDLDGLSGMLITSLEQSRRLSVLTRSRMLDVLKQMGKGDVDRIDESLGREICRQTNVGALVVASVRRFDQLYIIDMKVLDAEKNEYIITLKEEAEGKSSIPGMIDKLSEKTRLGLNEKASEVEENSKNVAEMTTPSMEAYQAYFRGEELINKLKFDEAAEEFRQAVAIDSTFAVAHYRLAYTLQWNGNPGADAAIAAAMRYVNRVPKRENYLIRGEDALVRNDVLLGLSIYKELLALYPDDKEVNYLVGDYSFHQEDYPTAERTLRKVLALDPSFARAHQHLAWTMQYSGRFDDMKEVARNHVRQAPSINAYVSLADAFIQQGEFDSALSVLHTARSNLPDNARIAEAEAAVHVNAGDNEKASVLYRDLSSPSHPYYTQIVGLYGLSTVALQKGAYRESARKVDEIIEIAVTKRDCTHLGIALINRAITTLASLRDEKSAAMYLDRALALMPHANMDFYIPLQIYYKLAGDFAKANEVARAKVSTVSGAVIARTEAYQEYHSGNFGSAIRLFNSIRFYFHEDLFFLAQSYIATGKQDSAITCLNRLQDQYGITFGFDFNRAMFYPRSHYLAGIAYENKREKPKAIHHYEKFLSLWKNADPDIPELVDGKKRLAALRSISSN